jgi:hypothetical protein
MKNLKPRALFFCLTGITLIVCAFVFAFRALDAAPGEAAQLLTEWFLISLTTGVVLLVLGARLYERIWKEEQAVLTRRKRAFSAL